MRLFIEILKIAFIANLYIYSIIIPIWTVYRFSIKSRHSYPNTFPISSPIVPLYRLSIVSLYRCHYTFPIWIAYKIVYKESLYFDIPGVLEE